MVNKQNKLTQAEQAAQAELDAKALLQKYDRESNFREEIGVWAWVVTFLGVSLTVFHVYTGYFGTFQSQKQGAVHLGTALGLIFLLFPFKKGQQLFQKTVPWYDVVLAFLAMYVTYYKVINFDALIQGITWGYDEYDTYLSIIGILLLLEATRRTVGVPIVIVALAMMAYAMYGNHIPTRLLSHQGYDITDMATRLWYRDSGVFGTPIQISAKYIFLFLFFGVILEIGRASCRERV